MKAKAAIFSGPREPIEIKEYELPEVEEKGVLVKVSLANICGSDVHIWRGEAFSPKGAVMGHEMTGRIASLGSGISTDATGKPLKEGDRVVYPYFQFCGTCRPCQHGRRTACQSLLQYPMTSADVAPHFRGAMAEYYYLPPGNPVFKVPDSLSDEVVAPVNCALSQVISGLHISSMKLGDAVVVQGAGGLGLYCAGVARDMGASIVIVLDRDQGRLDLAKDFGADVILNVEEFKETKELVGQIRKLTNGQGADVVMGLTGVPTTTYEGLKMLVSGGCMVEIGNISIGGKVPMDPAYIVLRSLSLKGVAVYEPWALAAALDFLERNREKLPLDRILSHKFPFEDINKAFEMADRGEVVRATISFED